MRGARSAKPTTTMPQQYQEPPARTAFRQACPYHTPGHNCRALSTYGRRNFPYNVPCTALSNCPPLRRYDNSRRKTTRRRRQSPKS